MTWTQVYTPLGNLTFSALVAAIPVVVLLVALAFFHVKAHIAALLGLALALAIAVGVYGMPLSMAAATAGYGAAFGLLPIGWIILNAIFIYDITVKTGKFEVVKDTIGGLAGDRRIQVLLIAFAFGAFIEGAAGFGTPVAISAACSSASASSRSPPPVSRSSATPRRWPTARSGRRSSRSRR